jgi:NAD(P)-dependent dehydrogenase (short-subunit alcohol dehydrogenase family)
VKVEDLDHAYAVNVRGTMLCYKYAAIQMIAQGRGGRIIGASSTTGKKGEDRSTSVHPGLIKRIMCSRAAISGAIQRDQVCHPGVDAGSGSVVACMKVM